jgi:hypothetical protein
MVKCIRIVPVCGGRVGIFDLLACLYIIKQRSWNADLPLPFFNKSQNADGDVASPGKRQARPTIAIGTWFGLLVEGMVPETSGDYDIRSCTADDILWYSSMSFVSLLNIDTLG